MDTTVFNPPVLAICTGVPGSGKTTLAIGYDSRGNKVGDGILHFTNRMAYLDKDMFVSPGIEKRYGESYRSAREYAYRAIDVTAECNLRLGTSVWIDATYATEVQNPHWADRYDIMAKQTGSKLKLIRCFVPEETNRAWLKERGYERDLEKLNDWEGFRRREPMRVFIPHGGIEIDRSGGLENNVPEVIEYLRKPLSAEDDLSRFPKYLL